MADNLHDLGIGALGKEVRRLAGLEGAAVLDGALDELAGLERRLGFLYEGIGDIGFTDVDDGVEVVRKAAELTDVLA